MNFNRRSLDDEPEVNLIPLIDVLLVILIFLMDRFSRSSGTISSVNALSCAGSRKKYVSFVVTRS